MKRTNNYLIMRDQAKSYFLKFDQQMLAERWNLPMDGQTLYVSFFEQPYRIDRKSGSVFRLETGEKRKQKDWIRKKESAGVKNR